MQVLSYNLMLHRANAILNAIIVSFYNFAKIDREIVNMLP